jgi:chemotaxis protein methyltransferase CheR
MMDAMPFVRDDELPDLLDQIYRRFHYDFRHYSARSLKRRLDRALLAMRCEDVLDLRRRLDADAAAFSELLRFLTVQVSDLFRDPEHWRTLRERIVPVLATYPSLRIWIPGSSTGEELYTLAILLREEGLLDRTTFYCTDINADALHTAERGIYPIDRAAKFTENHRLSGGKGSLSTHYTAAYGSIVFDRSLRKRAVFSDHSLATDSVFAEVELVSCRNVLIYFERALQARAVALFEEALCRRGYLGLGSRENLRHVPAAHAFGEVDGGTRWYRKCQTAHERTSRKEGIRP